MFPKTNFVEIIFPAKRASCLDVTCEGTERIFCIEEIIESIRRSGILYVFSLKFKAIIHPTIPILF